MFLKIQRIHFVGIGGIGMSGIAEVLLTLGYRVSGSDLRRTATTERLTKLGAQIFEGHSESNVQGAEVVVASSAISVENSEVAEARRLHLPVIQRAEMLAELMRLKYGIAIAGMHGKTSTTSMVAAVLAAGGLDPTVVVGGRVDSLGSNARLGTSQYLVAEADESDRSFLKLSPIISVVTNIDREHMDCYRDMDDVNATFVEFMDRVPFYGTVVACMDDEGLRNLLPRVQRRVVTYGTCEAADFRAIDVKTDRANGPMHNSFGVRFQERDLGRFDLFVPGAHNVLNATAAIAVGMGLEIPVERIREGIAQFRGVDRRFQHKGTAAGVSVVDDYGHHPTEILATLAAARQWLGDSGRIHVIFQPHRYTRTYLLMDGFVSAFPDADRLLVLDIYAASEQPIAGISGLALAKKVRCHNNHPAEFAASFEAAVDAVVEQVQPGDMVLTLGAGSVSQLGAQILKKLHGRQKAVGA
ncbi:MAG: UDP-N-acetylmuramate--L-alanine ligase [Acidobacteria bacterium]|nr:MAG: UDP-N-acetylmuramate--L-alanine ligase [Acidobacteriota bacterium]